MGALALIYESDDKYIEICEYLNDNEGFWIKNDIWTGRDKAFAESGIQVKERVKTWTIADFTTFKQEQLKNEMKYFLLKRMKEEGLTAYGCSANYLRAMRNIGNAAKDNGIVSFMDEKATGLTIKSTSYSETECRMFEELKKAVIRLIQDMYDETPELEKDKWRALSIPGVVVEYK